MNYTIDAALGRPFWDTTLVLEYADQTGEKPVVETLAGKTYCQFPKAGFNVVLNPADAFVDTIQLFCGDNHQVRYEGSIPFNLRFEMGRVDVERLLGKPTVSGGGQRNPITGGIVAPWVRYDKDVMSVHCEFGRD